MDHLFSFYENIFARVYYLLDQRSKKSSQSFTCFTRLNSKIISLQVLSVLFFKMASAQEEYVTRKGGCHCGKVRFEVLAPKILHVYDCK